MSFIGKLLGKKSDAAWTPTHRGAVIDISYEEIQTALGRGTKSKGGFVFWRGELTDLDPDYPEGHYQLSNYDDRRGEGQNARVERRNRWYVVATSARAIRLVADEVGGLARNIEEM
jgi:hypothetical protein